MRGGGHLKGDDAYWEGEGDKKDHQGPKQLDTGRTNAFFPHGFDPNESEKKAAPKAPKEELKGLHADLSKQGYTAEAIPEGEKSEKTRGMKSIVDKDGKEVFRGRSEAVREWLNAPDTEKTESEKGR